MPEHEPGRRGRSSARPGPRRPPRRRRIDHDRAPVDPAHATRPRASGQRAERRSAPKPKMAPTSAATTTARVIERLRLGTRIGSAMCMSAACRVVVFECTGSNVLAAAGRVRACLRATASGSSMGSRPSAVLRSSPVPGALRTAASGSCHIVPSVNARAHGVAVPWLRLFVLMFVVVLAVPVLPAPAVRCCQPEGPDLRRQEASGGADEVHQQVREARGRAEAGPAGHADGHQPDGGRAQEGHR